jgi:hypothetical protein
MVLKVVTPPTLNDPERFLAEFDHWLDCELYVLSRNDPYCC